MPSFSDDACPALGIFLLYYNLHNGLIVVMQKGENDMINEKCTLGIWVENVQVALKGCKENHILKAAPYAVLASEVMLARSCSPNTGLAVW